MEKLPEDFKKKWIAELRSGKYTQGDSSLYDRKFDRYCCLGVACVVAGVKPDNRGYITADWIHASKIPSVLVGNTLDTVGKKLARMNDNGMTFLEIADYIEENL